MAAHVAVVPRISIDLRIVTVIAQACKASVASLCCSRFFCLSDTVVGPYGDLGCIVESYLICCMC